MSDAAVVIDTNVVLDLFVFNDPAVAALKAELEARALQWLATDAMRVELARVLGYPNIVAWSVKRARDPLRVGSEALAQFDRYARIVTAAMAAPVLCADLDDQPFIDLAHAHRAKLISHDRAVIDAWRRLSEATGSAP